MKKRSEDGSRAIRQRIAKQSALADCQSSENLFTNNPGYGRFGLLLRTDEFDLQPRHHLLEEALEAIGHLLGS